MKINEGIQLMAEFHAKRTAKMIALANENARLRKAVEAADDLYAAITNAPPDACRLNFEGELESLDEALQQALGEER